MTCHLFLKLTGQSPLFSKFNPHNLFSEKDLIKKCQAGKKASQYELVKQYSGMLLSVCRRYAKEDGMAKDILQETWIKIFGNINQYQPSGSFEGWMKKIAVRTALYWNNKNFMIRETDLQNLARSPLISPEIYNQLDEEEIILLIQDLPEGFKAVFNLNIIEGYSHKEISALLGITESTSRSQLARARKILMKKIQTLNLQIL